MASVAATTAARIAARIGIFTGPPAIEGTLFYTIRGRAVPQNEIEPLSSF
jgi:hypothetical protein